jgi:hypothetical protein
MLSGTLPAWTVLMLTAVRLGLPATMPLPPAAAHLAAATSIATAGAVALVSPTAGVSRAEAVVAIAGWLADREIGRRPCGRGRAFQAGQRRANQRPVNGSLVVFWLFVRSGHRCLWGVLRGERAVIGDGSRKGHRRRLFGRGGGGRRHGLAKLRSATGRQSSRVGLPAKPRQPRLLVFVLRLARRATRLLHVVPDHRDHYVVGKTAFPGAIIVKDVTKPKLALLHQNLPNVEPRWIKEGKRERRAPY